MNMLGPLMLTKWIAKLPTALFKEAGAHLKCGDAATAPLGDVVQFLFPGELFGAGYGVDLRICLSLLGISGFVRLRSRESSQ